MRIIQALAHDELSPNGTHRAECEPRKKVYDDDWISV